MSGTKISVGVRIKKDYVRADDTSALYIRIYETGKVPKKIPLDLYVPISQWDEKKERVKRGHPMSGDYNLIIKQKLSRINEIRVEYRLQGLNLTLEQLIEEVESPTSRMDFLVFWDKALHLQQDMLAKGTYKQQKSSLNKVRKYTATLPFTEINSDWITKFKGHLRTKEKNQAVTIDSCLKNFKKYLNLAKKSGLRFPLDPDEIKIRQPRTNRTSLDGKELDRMIQYKNADFTNETHKIICAKFIFCCLTGLRIGDFFRLTEEDIIGEYILNYNHKSNFKQKIQITPEIRELLDHPFLLENIYTKEHLNEELKVIAKVLGIKKRLTWHVSRHTFATQYLITGGQIQNLQRLMGHSKIETTMVYIHEAEQQTGEEMRNLSRRFKG